MDLATICLAIARRLARSKWSCVVGLMIIILSSSGCQMTVHHVPKDLTIAPGSVPRLVLTSPIRLTNAQPRKEKIKTETVGYTLLVDYNEYTALFIDILRKEIERSGGSISPRSPKEIKVAITDVGLTNCMVNCFSSADATVKLGDGRVRGFNAQSSGSPSDGDAIDKVMVKLAVTILNDERVRSYLENK